MYSAAASPPTMSSAEDVRKMIEGFTALEGKIKEMNERNRGVIVEVHNCAVFLSQVAEMIGKEGPASFDMELRSDVVSAKPVNFPDMTITCNISEDVLGVPIGEKGKTITLDDIIRKLNETSKRSKDHEFKYSVTLLLGVLRMLGKDGPLWFEHGIVENSNTDAGLDALRRVTQGAALPVPDKDSVGYGKVELVGELLCVPIGQEGKKVTISDFADAFFEVSTNPGLEAFRKSGRSYLHEGFCVKHEGLTLKMNWGS